MHEARQDRADVAGVIELGCERIAQARLGLRHLLRIDELSPGLGEGRVDRVADIGGVTRVHQARRNDELAGIDPVGEVRKQLVDGPVLDDELLIQV